MPASPRGRPQSIGWAARLVARPCPFRLDLAGLRLAPYPLRLMRSRPAAATPAENGLCFVGLSRKESRARTFSEHPPGVLLASLASQNVVESDNGGQANRWTNCQRWTGDHRQQIRSGSRQRAIVKGGRWGQQRDGLACLPACRPRYPFPLPSPGLVADVEPCRWMGGQRVNGLHSGR